MKDDGATAVAGCFGIIVLTVILMAGAYLLDGWVLSILWGWFVVPVFHAPILAVVPAMGISTTVGFLTYHKPAEDSKAKSTTLTMIEGILYAVFVPLFALLTGYIIHLFM